MKRLMVIGLFAITALVTLALAGPAGAARAGDLIVGPAAIDAGDWTPVSKLGMYCQRRCDEFCFQRCRYRDNCQRGPQHCYRGTTCHNGVCRQNQTICQPGPVYCAGGWHCYNHCRRRCERRCLRRYHP